MAATDRSPNGTAQGLALVLGSGLAVMAVIALAPVLPEMMTVFRDLPNAGFWVPTLISVGGLGAALSAPLAGFIGDRYGRRVPLIAFSILFALAGGLPLVLSDFTAIFISRIVVGAAAMGVLVVSTAMIGDMFSGDKRDRWLAGQAMVATFSALLFMPLAGFLGAWLGWRGPFLLFLAGLPLAAAYSALLRGDRSQADGGGPAVKWSALPWPWLLRISAVFGVVAILFYVVQMQIGLALATVGVSDPARIGMLSAFALAGIPAGAVAFMKGAGQPFGRLIRLELLACGATLMAMRYVDDYRAFLAVAFVNLMASGMMLPTMMTHLTRGLDESVRARGIGISQSAFSAGQFLSVGLSAAVMQRPGATVLDAFWTIGAGGVAIAVLSVLLLAQNGPRTADLPAN